jgi:thioredoxin-related protein
MRFILFLMLVVFQANTFATTYTPELLPAYSKIYDEKRDPFADATAALELAKQTHRNVLLEIGGNWCTWCHRMDKFLEENPEVYQALHNHYVLLKISVSDENENKAFMSGLPPVLGYPHMFVSSNTGKMLLSKDTGELQENGDYSARIWLEFLQQWQLNSTTQKATP